ncbi:cordon-bleu protein-like 1 isoform X2 [Venturia canescens]|uniref:cordon-bleu protein-like 1 isoform X2 n=1 Tax=Venturia canescens TaxID=32260 RepID=UPI001C9D0A72|nr:cordon-bleu protein-like 1 isoform X2 [Venturia canescens]
MMGLKLRRFLKIRRSREERSSGAMVLTVTEDTPADMLAGSMELLVQLPRDHNVHTQRVTVPRSTPMMDLLVQIATAHKLSASSYTLQAIGERGLVLPHQPNTPIGALDALQVKLLPKQGTFVPKKVKQANQPFETTFRLQVLLPRNQLYVSRVSPKMNLGKILEEVCREKNLDKNKYELRHPANLEETLDLSLSLQDYHLQEVTLYAKQGRTLGAALSSQDIMALQRQEERRRQQAKQSVFGFIFRKSKESSLSIDSLGGRSVSPARSDETGRSVSPLAPPSRPLRKRRPAPKPPVRTSISGGENDDESKEKLVISHSRNSSDSSGYHEASVLSDNPESNARMPETLPRRSKPPCKLETSRKLAQTSQASKSLGNLAVASGGLSHGISSTSISSTGVRKKRAAPPPPIARPLSSAISTQALERIVDSEESLTSDIDISKSPSDIAASSKANSDIGVSSKANSDIGVHSLGSKQSSEIGYKIDAEFRAALADHEDIAIEIKPEATIPQISTRLKPSLDLRANINQPESGIVPSLEKSETVEIPRTVKRETKALVPTPKPRNVVKASEVSLLPAPRNISHEGIAIDSMSNDAVVISEQTKKMVDNETSENIRLEETTKSLIDSAEKYRKNEWNSAMHSENNLKKGVLKHVKSLDDICALSREFPDNVSEEELCSSSLNSSCAIISTIPKCSHLAENVESNVEVDDKKNSAPIMKTDDEVEKNPDIAKTKHPVTKKRKVFRSQSALDDFEMNQFERPVRHLSSHTEDFNCALNPNVSRSIVNLESNENNHKNERIHVDDDASLFRSHLDFPPFILQTTNLRCREVHTKVVEMQDNWQPQLIGESASPDRPTETDILLQKVSDTLSNSLPIPKLPLSREVPVPITSEKLSNDRHAATDESDGIRESLEMKNRTNEVKPPIGIETKNAESFLSSRNNLTCSPDATLNSQQDTSDYVSATGDDLSITDWEYQLPAPPSAFRDNISPDFDGYDTITLRSVEAFKESPPNSPKEGDKNLIIESSTPQSITPPDQAKIPGSPKVDQSVAAETSSGLPNNLQIPSLATTKVSKSPQNLQVQSSTTAKSSKSSKSLEVEHSTTKNVNIKASASSEESVQQQKPKLSSQVSIESRNAVPTTELKKEIINELSTKLGNGSLQQSTGKILETDTRRAVSEVFAPKIAPVDNTLSNFTITTYSRKKSLDIFENEPVKENCRSPQLTNTTNKNEASDFSIVSKISSENGKGNFGSKTTLNACGNNVSEEKMFVDKSESKNGLEKTEVEFKQLETKIHSTPHDSLLRNASFNRAAEKITTVHRSKSYITLANNSKYREDVNFERDDGGKQMEQVDGRIIKSTSVTNLHYETPRNNEKFSQWRENILKKQEEPSKEKQLQSLEILKNILPRLKTNQQTEENVSDPSNDQESSSHIGSKALPEVGSIESFSSVSELRAESEEPKPQTLTEEATTKRYKYTGPPAISLGSWSERPRVNVQLKMDTDYKFTTSDNTSGGKTRVNLNGTSNEKSEQKLNTLPRNFANNVTINRAIGHDESLARQKSEEQLSKKLISHTTAAGYKKPISSRIVFSETKKTSEDREDQGGRLMMSAALKKITNKKSEPEKRELEDDVRIDTKPVNFRELSKTFGEEVCLRAKPKRLVQNRHSDYYGTKPDIVQNLPINGQNSVWEAANKNALKHADSTKNHVGNGGTLATNQGTLRRYTSVVGIQSQNNNRGTEGFETVPKNYVTSTKINGLMPVVKGFKISTNEPKIVNSPPGENGVLNKDSTKNISNVPPPPTMPVITGVTLKNSSSRPKSVPICNVDPRDQLLESIRNFGGRDRLKSLNS